eukprot:snap_masked-scaffold_8-processed-gene-6.41-mRNA-1 protein AED:0.04 eAED:0.04 QI:0/-1/0/1/-1/1/1/0/152
MNNTKTILVELTHDILNLSKLNNFCKHPKAGAISSFCGITRDNFNSLEVIRLSYEAYESMALKQIWELCEEAKEKFSLIRIGVQHRVGEVGISEESIIIVASSAHRKESIQGVSWLLDQLKTRVAIWKKEIYANEKPAWKQNKEFNILKDQQ